MPTNIPKISLIVPVYNVERYLRQCLDSVMAQDFNGWEAVLVDDGSTDGSGNICDEYAERDNRFIVLHQQNRGVAAARNAGLRICTGEYIFFLDPDDWISPSFCSSLHNAAVGSGCDIAVGRMYFEYPKRSVAGKSRFPTRTFTALEFASLLCKDREFQNYMWGKLFHRRLLTLVPSDVRYFEDVAFTISWVLKAEKVIYVSECMGYHYRQRASSILGSKDKIKAIAYFDAVKTRLLQFIDVAEGSYKPSLAANCVVGIERAMCSIARGRLLANRIDISDKNTVAMISELAELCAPLVGMGATRSSLMTFKQRFGFRLASRFPRLYMAWARFGELFHRHPSSERVILFD